MLLYNTDLHFKVFCSNWTVAEYNSVYIIDSLNAD